MTALVAPSAPALVFQSTEFHPVPHDGKVWLTAAEIAQALGYTREDAVSRIYQRHAEEFRPDMALTVSLTVKGFGGGNSEKEVRIFSLRGAHLIGMHARTPAAKQFRSWVLDTLDQQNGAPDQRIAQLERAARALLDAATAHATATRFLVDLRGPVQPVAADQMCISWAELASSVADPNTLLSNAELSRLASACGRRLEQRLAH